MHNAETLPKGKFAEHIGVTAGRVSQYLADGIIGQDALVGTGRNARIKVEVAKAQIRQRRDIGQAMGNGLGTRVNGGESPPPARQPAAIDGYDDEDALTDDLSGLGLPRRVTVEDEIKQERLLRERRLNRQADEADAIRRGQIMETGQARAEMNRIAGRMMSVFEGALPDFATAIAAKFEIPQRDVLHVLRHAFTEVRKNAEAREIKRRDDLPELREIVLDGAGDE